MTAFLIFHSTINDTAKFKQYAEAVGATLRPFNGEVSLRGKVANVLKGEHAYQNVGVLRFPDITAAENWYQSPNYQALIANRDQAAEIVVISFEEPPG